MTHNQKIKILTIMVIALLIITGSAVPVLAGQFDSYKGSGILPGGDPSPVNTPIPVDPVPVPTQAPTPEPTEIPTPVPTRYS